MAYTNFGTHERNEMVNKKHVQHGGSARWRSIVYCDLCVKFNPGCFGFVRLVCAVHLINSSSLNMRFFMDGCTLLNEIDKLAVWTLSDF